MGWYPPSRCPPMRDVQWVRFHSVADVRGSLTAVEGEHDVPFPIARVFYMHDVTPGADRGGHAHRDTDQVAIAVHGSLKLCLADGDTAITVVLDDPRWGVTLPRMTWTRLYDFSSDGVCLILASTHYDMSRSIRDWPAYLAARSLSARPEPLTGPALVRPHA